MVYVENEGNNTNQLEVVEVSLAEILKPQIVLDVLSVCGCVLQPNAWKLWSDMACSEGLRTLSG